MLKTLAILGWTLALLAVTLPAAKGADVTVGTATAHVGDRATGFIQVPAGVDAPTNIPVIIIHGVKAGPKLALVAGSHGTEYASIIALEKLAQSISPSALCRFNAAMSPPIPAVADVMVSLRSFSVSRLFFSFSSLRVALLDFETRLLAFLGGERGC